MFAECSKYVTTNNHSSASFNLPVLFCRTARFLGALDGYLSCSNLILAISGLAVLICIYYCVEVSN